MESSFDCYTPLERPGPKLVAAQTPSTVVPIATEREDGECDTESDSPAQESSSDSDLDSMPRKILMSRRKRTTGPVPTQPIVPVVAPPQTTPILAKKKYNIWAERIREDSLTETMRNFGVDRDEDQSRNNIEWYDHTLGNRFAKDGKTNRLKRRRGSSAARRSRSDEDQDQDSMDMDCGGAGGKRMCYRQNKPRFLEDLQSPEDASLEELAKEVAKKLMESNEALIIQVTSVLGRELVQSIYKETQRIEEDGGMMIRGNRRRRTSGGVFLFLVKHNDEIGEERKREAFKPIVDPVEEATKRNEEIEELKKTLITQDSPKLNRTRVDIVLSSTLSNPPPSPEAGTATEDGELDEDAEVGVEQEDLNNNSQSVANDHMDFN